MGVKWFLKMTAAAALTGAVVLGGVAEPASAGRRLPPKVVGVTTPASADVAVNYASEDAPSGCLDKAGAEAEVDADIV